jgi:seryl-tRNA synthetase
MLDIRLIRDEPESVKKNLRLRNADEQTMGFVEQIRIDDEVWRKIKFEEEQARSERNSLSQEINKKKKAKEDASAEIERSKLVATRIKEISDETENLEKSIHKMMLELPNMLYENIPHGEDESKNPEVHKWGEPEKKKDDVISHYEMSKRSNIIDHERGAKLAGHRFSVLKGPIARLERALINFMLNVQTQQGYTEFAPPYMVNSKTMTGTGQLPKFEEDLYGIRDEDLWMIPTAEVPLTNLYADEVLEEKDLPLKMTAFTPCFRREAGAYGKDIHGLIRQHQFDKVELVRIVHPDRSFDELEILLKDAERILQLLELPYRVVELCSGDIGFSAAKTYDVEVWIPSQDQYREISSCSNCTDFQARRANLKYLSSEGKQEFVHTLNGSGLAVGRTMLSLLENHQEGKERIIIPKPLRDFMGCDEFIF